ncbi:MAG: PA14 domain-containing protein [Opitutaceae bacterium]
MKSPFGRRLDRVATCFPKLGMLTVLLAGVLATLTAANVPLTDWTNLDIGTVGLAGSGSFNSTTGDYTLKGAGSDIGGTADSFHYSYRPLSGDGYIIVRLKSLTTPNAVAKAGVMIRETLLSNSKNALMMVTPGSGTGMKTRATTGGTSVSVITTGLTAPQWLKLERRGNVFTGYYSADGVTWVPSQCIAITMATDVYVGVAASSCTTSALLTAVIDQVVVDNLDSALPWPWTEVSVGTATDNGVALFDGSYVLANLGADIASTADKMKFVTQSLTGDGTLTLKVSSLTSGTTAPRFGIMMRDTLATNARNILLGMTTPKDLVFQSRQIAGGTTALRATSVTLNYPIWLKLQRTGNAFAASYSMDGSSWVQQGVETIAMPPTIQIGVAYSNRSTTVWGIGVGDQLSLITPTDADGNGLPDAWEVAYFGATGAAPQADPDVDGLTNFQEWQLGNNPLVFNLNGQRPLLELVGGDAQTAQVNTVASQPLVLRVKDALSGEPVAGIPVTFLVSSGPGQIGSDPTWQTTQTLTSGADGLVQTQFQFSSTRAGVSTVRASIGGGLPSALVIFTLKALAGETPQVFEAVDLGAPAQQGTTDYAAGSYTLGGVSTTIGGTADTGHFAWQTFTGDGYILARVASFDAVAASSRAGIMMRESLAVNSRHVSVFATPSSGIAFQSRFSVGGATSVSYKAGPAAPYWVLLRRAGNVFSAFCSTDGATWVSVASPVTFGLNSTVYVGLALGANDTVVRSAAIDNIRIAPLVVSPWLGANIYMPNGAVVDDYGVNELFMRAGGSNISGSADSFRFVYQAMPSDGRIIARVAQQLESQPSVKSGVMIRETTASNARHVILATIPSTGVRLQKRATTGTVATTVASQVGALPRWLKLEKIGTRMDAFSSADGQAWSFTGTVTADYGTTALVGLAAHSDLAWTHTQTLFDNIQVDLFDGPRGWNAVYYDGANFDTLRVRRREYSIDCTWAAGEAPATGVSSTSYSIKYEADFVPTQSGLHTFTTLSQGGVRVIVDGQAIISNWTQHTSVENTGQISLTAGQPVRVLVEYANATGGAARLQLRVATSDQADALVATGTLRPTDVDLDGMNDAWETSHGLNPLSAADANLDADSDGLGNFQEFQLGTDPQVRNDRMPGMVVYEQWGSLAGTTVRDLTGNAAFLTEPNTRRILTQLDTVPDNGANYGSLTRGYLIPPEDGAYSFAVSGSDAVEFWLSPDDNSYDRTLVARAGAYTALRDYDAKQEQKSAPVQLQAGHYYYFEILQKEGFSHDHLSVVWTRPGAQREIITAPYIASFGLRTDDANDDGLPDAWQAAHGLSAQGAYDDFDGDGLINLYEYRLGLDPAVKDTDGDGFGDNLEVLSGTDPLTAVAPAITAPWQLAVLGTVPAPAPVNSPSADAFVIAGAPGTGMKINQAVDDNIQYVYRPVTGDFELVARIGDAGSVTTGVGLLTVRSTLDPQSASASLAVNPDGVHSVRTRDASAQTITSRMEFTSAYAGKTAYLAGYWVKLRRQGDQLNFYCSSDGQSWTQLTVIPFASDCLVGFAVNATTTDPVVRKFSSVRLTLDPVVAPEPNELPAGVTAQTIATINGNAGVTVKGQWATDGNGIVSQFFTGTLDYTFTVPADGIYRLSFSADSPFNQTTSTLFPVELAVDGNFVARVNLIIPTDESGVAQIITPWLKSGTHTVRIFWDNTLSLRKIRLNSLAVESLDGADANGNGRADWVDARLAGLNTLDLSENALFVSPVSLEGKVRFRDLLQLTADDQPVTARPAPGFGWYADVPLTETGIVQVRADFENTGIVQSLLLEWKSLNLLAVPVSFTGQTTQVRKGDSMRFTAFAAGQSGGNATVTVTAPGGTPVGHYLAIPQSQSWVQAFTTPGVYTIDATYTDAGNTVTTAQTFTVEVIEAAFASDPTAGLNNTPIVWDNPGIPGNVLLEADQGLSLSLIAPLPGGGSSFSLKTVNVDDSYIVARLGEHGPIFGHAVVHGVRAASNDDTSIDVLVVYPDGSKLIGVPIIVNRLTDDTVVEVVIFVNGVTFEDGTTSKTLTKADFDAYGRIYVKFIYPTGLITSFCHKIYIHEGATDLGTF